MAASRIARRVCAPLVGVRSVASSRAAAVAIVTQDIRVEGLSKSLKSSRVGDVTPTTTTSDRKVPTRRISFEASLRDLPKHFAADGDLIMSHVAASLSAVFP